MVYGGYTATSGVNHVVDNGNAVVRKIATNGITSTLASSGQEGYNGDNIPATAAGLDDARGVCVDIYGDVYIADSANYRIRKVTAATGIITTVVGTGSSATSGDGGAATSARINSYYRIAVDSNLNLYLVQNNANGRIRKVTYSTGIINTILTSVYSSQGMTLDVTGSVVYYSQTGWDTVNKLSNSINTTVAGNLVAGITFFKVRLVIYGVYARLFRGWWARYPRYAGQPKRAVCGQCIECIYYGHGQ